MRSDQVPFTNSEFTSSEFVAFTIGYRMVSFVSHEGINFGIPWLGVIANTSSSVCSTE